MNPEDENVTCYCSRKREISVSNIKQSRIHEKTSKKKKKLQRFEKIGLRTGDQPLNLDRTTIAKKLIASTLAHDNKYNI